MKIDRYIKNISDRLDSIISNYGTDDYGLHRYDDEYYLDTESEPPRFAYYRHVRVEKFEYAPEHIKCERLCSIKTVTQDELDYSLKRKLRVSPEQRYQHEKREPWFHELYVEGGRECNNLYDPCCIPGHCRFADEYGVITDEEVIEYHNNKVVEYYRQNNKMVEPPSEIEMQRLANTYRFDLI